MKERFTLFEEKIDSKFTSLLEFLRKCAAQNGDEGVEKLNNAHGSRCSQ